MRTRAFPGIGRSGKTRSGAATSSAISPARISTRRCATARCGNWARPAASTPATAPTATRGETAVTITARSCARSSRQGFRRGSSIRFSAAISRSSRRCSGQEARMDFSESDRVRGFRKTVREFMKKEVYPLEQKLRHDGFKALLPTVKEKRAKAEETRLRAAHIPGEWGGAGLSFTEFAHLSEELGRSPLGHYIFNVQAPDVGNMELLLSHGTPEQKDRWLRPLVRGDIRSCFTMTEPEFAGSNPVWMGTTAVKQDGDWVIRGHKWFSTAADGAAVAVCMAVTDSGANPHRRASMILVPTDTPGYELVGNISVMGHR